MDKSVTKGCAKMTVDERKQVLPLVATALAYGAIAETPWEGRDDVVGVRLGSQTWKMCRQDFEMAEDVADGMSSMVDFTSGFAGEACSPSMFLRVVEVAGRGVARQFDGRSGKRGVLMLKDVTGSGWWRMELPLPYLDADGKMGKEWYVDVTSAAVEFERALEYDVIVAQRVHRWEQYHVLKRLKESGKRLVYDIDDDMSSIPLTNPAYMMVGLDGWNAAKACMGLADLVTVSTPYLGKRMRQMAGIEDVAVVPNAWDLDDRWLPIDQIGSPDEWKRILWQGSSTHAADWSECAEAVIDLMESMDEIKLVILGFFPNHLRPLLDDEHYEGRVEFLAFEDVETYYEILHHVRADVALAPLIEDSFNASKSACKYVEYSCMGVPTVASGGVTPYADVIEHGVDGFLATSRREWQEMMEEMLFEKERARKVVAAARKKVRDQFDLKRTALLWREAIIG